jgi:hypothetical protein
MAFLNGRSKTTCELYREIVVSDLRPSVQTALYHCLHMPQGEASEALNKDHRTIAKNILKKINIRSDRWYQSRLKHRNNCDVIFSYINDNSNYLGIQQRLAEKCVSLGLKTGIVHQVNLDRSGLFQETILSKECFIPIKLQKDIVDQCKYLYSHYSKSNITGLQSRRDYLILTYFALRVEGLARWAKYLLELTDPKLVILTNARDLQDAALQITCAENDVTTMLIPHGFPQMSQYPLSASLIMSYGPKHDDYLNRLSCGTDQLRGLGWLEPTATLPGNINSFVKDTNNFSENDGYKILFLSQITGANRHRCPSLVEHVPAIIRALEKMDLVKTITFRLRHEEKYDLHAVKLLDSCKSQKLRISINNSISDDLKANNTVISFSSTGLLYAPYLNMKAVEIRDKKINSIWGENILPEKQVYQIVGDFNPNEFIDFVEQSPILQHEVVFYNWQSELETFTEYLHGLI